MTNSTSSTNSDPTILIITLSFTFVAVLISVLIHWKIFTKAGRPGWYAIIPIYNLVVLMRIIRKPVWLLLLFLVPLANYIVSILIALELAKAFGKSSIFGILLLWLFPIGYFILAFDKSTYLYGISQPPPISSQSVQSEQPVPTSSVAS